MAPPFVQTIPKNELRKNPDTGLQYVEIHSPGGATSQIYLYGGCVLNYRDVDGTEVLSRRKDCVLDGTVPIAGGIPHCWPQFGSDGDLQQHGLARYMNWTVKPDSLATDCVVLEVESNEYSKAMWDHDWRLEYSIKIRDIHLEMELKVQNKGPEPFSHQCGLHTYFNITDISNAEIKAPFRNTRLFNKLLGPDLPEPKVGKEGEMTKEERSTIQINKAHDHVYVNIKNPTVYDNKNLKKVEVETYKSFPSTVIWNPYGDNELGYKNFVCVESVVWRPEEVAAGAEWVGKLKLTPGIVIPTAF
jgi:glucose-6-phosphate 1-epimerase